MSEKLKEILNLVEEYVEEKNNKDWKPSDYRILLGDNVKLKNDDTIYKVTNMETITENPDEKVYAFYITIYSHEDEQLIEKTIFRHLN